MDDLEIGQVLWLKVRYQLDKVATVKALVDISKIDNPSVGTVKLSDIQLVAYDMRGVIIDVEIVPKTVQATIEIASPSKVVPVKIVPEGNVSFGKAISKITSSEESVTIYGDNETLSNIATTLKNKPGAKAIYTPAEFASSIEQIMNVDEFLSYASTASVIDL